MIKGSTIWFFRVFNPLESKKKYIWNEKKIEKNAFFGAKMGQNGHKMAQMGPVWGL